MMDRQQAGMSMTKRAQRHRVGAGSGFTIIEIVIVLTILGILGGVGVQYYMDLDDSSKAAICKSNRATLFRFLNMEKMLRKDFAPNLKKVDENDYICPSGSAPYTVSTKDGYAVVTCPNGHGITQAGNASGLSDPFNPSAELVAAMKAVKDIFKDESFPSGVDSGAQNAIWLPKVLEALRGMGINLEASEIKSWSYGVYASGDFIAWTAVDISKVPAGTWVSSIRYNVSKGTYTAGYTKVVSTTANGATYNILATSGATGIKGNWEEGPRQNDATKANYEQTKAVYKSLSETKP